ncbi:hypothetical protein KAI32_04575 [Candidatus Pacearchaeota archaeon]|nr:hypothetical protein [Candidatus Pacearchaeota archaeon]
MEKRGGLLIVGIVFIVLFLGAGFYFYNFYVFKTVRFCIGEAKDLEIPCKETLDCVNLIGDELSDAPLFIQENFNRVIYDIVYCEGHCFLRDVRGVNLETGELEILDSCKFGDKEILIEIRGKDGLEIWKWFESQKA